MRKIQIEDIDTPMTMAEKFAEMLGNDGQVWETLDGRPFTEAAEDMRAECTYSRRASADDGLPWYEARMSHEDGTLSEYISGDPIRYEFPDGSAVVVAGDGWDIEGEERYSWAGA